MKDKSFKVPEEKMQKDYQMPMDVYPQSGDQKPNNYMEVEKGIQKAASKKLKGQAYKGRY